jgi:hypothetical protein
VNRRDDHDADMSHTPQIRRRWELDDEIVEAIVQDLPVGDRFEPLVAFARQVRSAAVDLSGPAPSDELARILRGEDTHTTRGRAHVQVGRAAAVAAKAAGLGIAAKIGLGASLAAASVTGAGAAGVLPGPANDAVQNAIEVLSPLEFDGRRDAPESVEQPTNFGDEVSDDATGRSDGENGVDGHQIAEEAPGAENRPDPGDSDSEGSGQSDSTGLTRANETPAEAHAPDSVPSTVPGSPAGPSGNGDGNGGRPGAAAPSTVPDLPTSPT